MVSCGTPTALRVGMNSNLVRIQSVGWVAGKPASDLAVGDQIVWNFGHVYQVVKVTTSANGKWVFIDEANVVTGEVFGPRRMGAQRLVAMAK